MKFLSRRRALVAALVTLLAPLALSASPAAAADEDDGTKLKVKEGQKAPDVQLPATQIEKALPEKKAEDKTLRLKDLEGKKHVVLYFFPKALTGGWTKEACGFRDRSEQFARLDTVVIGISTDTIEDQKKFTDKENLNFPLFADSEQKAAKAFGVLMANKKYAQRVTFIIDKKGVVRKIYPKVDVTAHPDEVLEFVKDNLAAK